MTVKKTIDVPEQQQKEINSFVQEFNANLLPGLKPLDYAFVEGKVKKQYNIEKDWDKAIHNVRLYFTEKRTTKGTPNRPNIVDINIPEMTSSQNESI